MRPTQRPTPLAGCLSGTSYSLKVKGYIEICWDLLVLGVLSVNSAKLCINSHRYLSAVPYDTYFDFQYSVKISVLLTLLKISPASINT